MINFPIIIVSIAEHSFPSLFYDRLHNIDELTLFIKDSYGFEINLSEIKDIHHLQSNIIRLIEKEVLLIEC